MKKDKYKELFSESIADCFRKAYSDRLESQPDGPFFDSGQIYEMIEKPKDPKMGRFALPVFRFAGILKEKPPVIASKVVEAAVSGKGPVSISAVGGFINGRVDAVSLASDVISQVLAPGRNYGDSEVGSGKTVLVEYSSPNIAKPFGVGHLRTTVLGNSLRLIFKKLGYNTVGINYPGDWGTQFGKMIVAYDLWGTEDTLKGDAIHKLLELYVRFHEEVEQDPTLDDKARAAFKRLEEGDADAVSIWQKLKDISQSEFDRVYSMMGVEFDLVIGESFLNDKMDAVIDRLQEAGLTRISDGALIVELDDTTLPPALLRKADGATLYITRDLAGAIYRWQTYKFHESIYVVGSSQSDHFKQMLKVLSLLEEKEGVAVEDRMTARVKHVDFGWVKFGKQTMSTRRGNIILLEDVIQKAVDLAGEIIAEKNPDLQNSDIVAHQIGVGAVLFSQLSVRRQKDVNFDWKEVLNFDGETGPYLQYTHARLCSLLRNYGGEPTSDIDFALLTGTEESRVIELLADFPSAIADAGRNYEPYILVQYLISLAAAFNTLYQRRTDEGRIDKIVSENAPLSAARIALVRSVQLVIGEGLTLLGIKSPEEM